MPLSKEDKLKRVLNEPKLYLENIVKIVDKNGKKVPFKLNPQQNELVEGLDKYNIVLKSRQLGITSVSCGLSLFYCNTKPNVTCLLMSYSLDSARGIAEKLRQMYFDLPVSLRQKLVNNNKNELKFSNGSRIVIATCGTKDVARGLTIYFAHLSEVAFMKENVASQLLAIEQALVPSGKIILESTANGLNHFSEMYHKAEKQESLYKPFFFGWVNDKLMFKDEYIKFSTIWRNRNGYLPTKKELDDEEKVLYKQGASIDQLIWRRLKIGNSTQEKFAQEFPSNPLEAFVTTGSNIFTSAQVHACFNNVGAPIKVPSDIPNQLRYGWAKSYQMWASVKKGEKYYMGVDTSEGLKQDFSTIEIIDSNGFQVAEFRSNTVKPYLFAQIVYEMAIYFNNAYIVVEKASAGHIVVDKLKNEYGYRNLHKHKEYDNRGGSRKKSGFITNSKTKPLIINDFAELFDQNLLMINSTYLLNEMKLYSYDNGKMYGVGGHDDLVMAMAMAIHGMKAKINYR